MEYKKKRTSVKYVVWKIFHPNVFITLEEAKQFIETDNIKIDDYILEKVTVVTERLEG